MDSPPTQTSVAEPGTLSAGDAHGSARRVAVNAVNPFIAQLFTKVLMLGYVIVQYRVLGAEANGVLGNYFLAGVVLMYMGTISEWGLGTLLTREVARERGDYNAVGKLFRQALTVRLVLSLALFLPVAVLIAGYVSFGRLTMDGAWAIAILTLSLLPGALSGSITAVLYAYERMSLPAIVGIATSLLNVILGIAAVLAGMGVIGLALSALAATCVTALVFLYILRRSFPGLSVELDFSGLPYRTAGHALLRAGWPLMLNALLVGLFFRIDQFIVEPVLGGGGVEKYNAAYQYINFVLLITPAVTLALFPRMARHAVNDRPRLILEYSFAIKALLLLAVPVIALIVWFAPLLITIVTGGKAGFLPASTVALQILIFFLPFSFVNGVTQYFLIALDKQRLITWAFAITVLFNVAANLVLVPWLGINGAAITTVLSEMVLLVPFAWWVSREAGGRPLLSLAWRPLIAGSAVAVLEWLLAPVAGRWQASLGDFATYLGAGVALALLCAAVMILLRPFTSDEMSTLRGALRRAR